MTHQALPPTRQSSAFRLVAAYLGALLIPVQLFAVDALSWLLMPKPADRAWNTGQYIANVIVVIVGLIVLGVNCWWFLRAHRTVWAPGRHVHSRRAMVTLVISVYLVAVLAIALVWVALGYAIIPGDADHRFGANPGFDLRAQR